MILAWKCKSLTVTAVLLTSLLFPAMVFNGSVIAQDSKQVACDTLAAVTGEECERSTIQEAELVESTVKRVLDVLVIIAAAAVVIMLIVGGIKYTVSGGATEKVAEAKKTIIYAIVGLVILVLAQFIINLTLGVADCVKDGVGCETPASPSGTATGGGNVN